MIYTQKDASPSLPKEKCTPQHGRTILYPKKPLRYSRLPVYYIQFSQTQFPI
jgi:hypothetical protein